MNMYDDNGNFIEEENTKIVLQEDDEEEEQQSGRANLNISEKRRYAKIYLWLIFFPLKYFSKKGLHQNLFDTTLFCLFID